MGTDWNLEDLGGTGAYPVEAGPESSGMPGDMAMAVAGIRY